MNKQLIKLSPLTNPNFNMLNTADELIELLSNENMVVCNDEVIGFVNKYGIFYTGDGYIHGEIIVFTDKEYEWINAEGYLKDDELVDNCGKFDKITAIYVKEVK